MVENLGGSSESINGWIKNQFLDEIKDFTPWGMY